MPNRGLLKDELMKEIDKRQITGEMLWKEMTTTREREVNIIVPFVLINTFVEWLHGCMEINM